MPWKNKNALEYLIFPMLQAVFIVHQNVKIVFHQPIGSGRYTPTAELIAGFLTALAAFTDEIGAGNIEHIDLENVKFVFKVGRHDLLYVFAIENNDSVDEAADKLRNVRRVFEEKYAAVLKHALANGADFSGFSKNLDAILNINKG